MNGDNTAQQKPTKGRQAASAGVSIEKMCRRQASAKAILNREPLSLIDQQDFTGAHWVALNRAATEILIAHSAEFYERAPELEPWRHKGRLLNKIRQWSRAGRGGEEAHRILAKEAEKSKPAATTSTTPTQKQATAVKSPAAANASTSKQTVKRQTAASKKRAAEDHSLTTANLEAVEAKKPRLKTDQELAEEIEEWHEQLRITIPE